MYSNNSTYNAQLTTLTEVVKDVIKAKFYTIKNLPDFVDIDKGRGGYADKLLQWAVYDVAGSFENGNVGSNADFERKASVDVLLNNVTFYRQQWAKTLTYNLMDLKQSNFADVINIVEQKEEARKRNWDLGIQKTIFLGSDENANITGLLNNPNVTVDTTTITKSLGQMTEAEFNTFIGAAANAFQANSGNFSMFNTFVLPTDDYNSLSTQMSATFPLKTKLQVLQEAFDGIVKGYGENGCKILPVAYANAANNPSGLNTYVLYRKDIDTLRYDLPVDYTATAFDTFNNFSFSNVGYGMYGSTNILRPQEVLYFTR